MKRRSFCTWVLTTMTTSLATAQEPEVGLALAPGELEVQPSFETCSYYYRPKDAADGGPFVVEFRERGASDWRRGFEAVSDLPEGVWKGSLFGLREDSHWEVRVLSAAGQAVARAAFRTWSSHPPVARVVDLSEISAEKLREGLVISDRGAPDGWIRYTAPEGWVLRRDYDVQDPLDAAITFRGARYVILDGVTVAGGRRYAVQVDDCDSVRVRNCDLSGWGRVGVQQFTNDGNLGKYVDARGDVINLDAGVEIHRSARTVVERCYLHDPRHRANAWMFSHPTGPCAVHVNRTRGGTVLRWNDMVGSDEHRWNDVIESSQNSSPTGGFFRDSDAYGNYLAFGNDDGVELEGGGMSVRFYGNKIEGTTCGVSTGACILGPQYVFGNLIANPGDESGLSLMFFKNSHRVEQGGRRYFVGNTLYGPDCSAYGSYGRGALPRRIGFMRNNLFVCNDSRLPGEWGAREDFDNDLFWAGSRGEKSAPFLEGLRALGQERHGLAADPRLAGPNGGDYRLSPDSPARGRAAAVANLCAAGDDLGAFTAARRELPDRPLALRAEPRQLNFAAPGETRQAELVVSLPAGEARPCRFRVRQNRAFDWFTVTPAAGEVAPGGSLTLTVTVDPARLRGRPLFKGAFLVRTPEGLSRPISVYARGEFREDPRPAAAPDTVYVEAAKHAGATPGGRHVLLAAEAGAQTLEAEVTLPRAGEYALLARAAVEGGVLGSRAFELTLDDAGEPAAISFSADYNWNVGDERFRVVWLHALGRLEAGKHRLRLRAVRGALKVSELILTQHPAVFFPQHWQRERPPAADQGAR